MSAQPVTMIGLGSMGTVMAETFLAAGHPTTVWNRTPARAERVVAKGAVLAGSPQEALAAGELIVISLVDYQAMFDILGGAGEEALAGRVLVNLSSDSPQRLREAARWAGERGARLLTGGIMVPPPGIGQPGAYTFYSGPEAALDAHRDTLQVLSEAHYMGEDPGLAMLYYQAMLHVFWTSLSSYLQSAALVGTAGVPASRLLPYIAQSFKDLAGGGPLGFLGILTREVEAGRYPGEENNLHMQAVGAEHVLHAFRDAGLDTGLPQAVSRLFATADAAGYGADGLTSVIEVIRKPVV